MKNYSWSKFEISAAMGIGAIIFFFFGLYMGSIAAVDDMAKLCLEKRYNWYNDIQVCSQEKLDNRDISIRLCEGSRFLIWNYGEDKCERV